MINLTHETAYSSVELFQITKITIAFEENSTKWQTIFSVLLVLLLFISVSIIFVSIIILLLRK